MIIERSYWLVGGVGLFGGEYTSPSSSAASRMVTRMPSRQKEMAAARPPIPAPMMPTWMFLWSGVFGWLLRGDRCAHHIGCPSYRTTDK